MKKLLSVLLAVSLLLCAVCSLAEETTVTEIENTPSYDAVPVNIGDLGLAIMVPADFQNLDVPEDAIMKMGNDDMTMTVSVMDKTMAELLADIDAAVAEGSLKNEEAMYINALYYVTVESDDSTLNAAFIELDETHVLRFTFATEADFASSIPAEIIGSLMDAEETEEAE